MDQNMASQHQVQDCNALDYVDELFMTQPTTWPYQD